MYVGSKPDAPMIVLMATMLERKLTIIGSDSSVWNSDDEKAVDIVLVHLGSNVFVPTKIGEISFSMSVTVTVSMYVTGNSLSNKCVVILMKLVRKR
jgi:hypothetical protein